MVLTCKLHEDWSRFLTAKGCWVGGWAVIANEFLWGLMKLLELDSDDGCTVLQILKNKTKQNKNPSELKKKKERWDKPSADFRNGRMCGASTVSVNPITFLL